MRSVFLAPHHDDETLFGTFTLLREKPHVVVVYDGGPEREAETEAACAILGCTVAHWRLPLHADPDARLSADVIYAPLIEAGGQPQHNLVGWYALQQGAAVTRYLTYTTDGKSTDGMPVAYEPAWVALKMRALACYPSQSGHPSHAPHFVRDQTEFYA